MKLNFFKSPFGSIMQDNYKTYWTVPEIVLVGKFEDNFLKLYRLGSFAIPREQAKQIRQTLKDCSGDGNEFISIGKVSDSHGQEQFYITDNDTEETLFFEIDTRNEKEDV
tara:strand:- start:330 stop:659 length:330 start_codon:yes stop_codon:yes gene_type:complete